MLPLPLPLIADAAADADADGSPPTRGSRLAGRRRLMLGLDGRACLVISTTGPASTEMETRETPPLVAATARRDMFRPSPDPELHSTFPPLTAGMGHYVSALSPICLCVRGVLGNIRSSLGISPYPYRMGG